MSDNTLQCQRVLRCWIIIHLQITRHMTSASSVVYLLLSPPNTFKSKLNRRLGLVCGSKFSPCRVDVSILVLTEHWYSNSLANTSLEWRPMQLQANRSTSFSDKSDRALAFRVNFYSCTSDLVRTLTDRTHEAIKSYNQSTQFFWHLPCTGV